MLFAIHSGQVEEYAGGQQEVIHLQAEAEQVAAHGYPFVFADGHADMVPLSTFYDDLADLNCIDWGVMTSRYWSDTVQNPDRKRRRQAEFLVHGIVPWSLFQEVGVANARAEQQVAAILATAHHRPAVRVHREWYY